MNMVPKWAVYVGRFNPIHFGHIKVMEKMLEQFGPTNSLVIIGSSNTPQSLRHFFSYEERKVLIKRIFPEIKLVGLPDYMDDKVWLSALGDILQLANINIEETVFFGGSTEDVRFFEDAGYNIQILNRFEGPHARISATEVRDALVLSKSLDGLIHPTIEPELKELFQKKWENFKKI